ncbi:hypothetical protein DAPPUDRAFT_254235 [Daphnia pulex]|uniref:Uncharacterized protein n=1 Tax=Daphnia pulex TaxID=6669 RepID=E9H6L8_DAPPU|nr:hypothetical protein DAPPUDRAFT_254235 [Daphnia pulex]|eukprot:EFX72612.1 hypothetical protein DAPPUDRAFT_254235 [Daphnia pulex]
METISGTATAPRICVCKENMDELKNPPCVAIDFAVNNAAFIGDDGKLLSVRSFWEQRSVGHHPFSRNYNKFIQLFG